MHHVLQTSTITAVNRYPRAFQMAREIRPDARRILSFGCSTGEELETILTYWPATEVSGVEIVVEARRKAADRAPCCRVYAPGELNGQRFDVIFAMSVLCRWPEKTAGILPYQEFAEAVRSLDRHLLPGGLLVAINATYNTATVLPHYHAFMPGWHNLVTPRERDGSEAKSSHPVLFRKPRRFMALRRALLF